MKAIISLFFLLVVLTAAGCAMKLVSYSPAILMEGTGRVKMGNFRYLPGDEGGLQTNQIDTGAGLSPMYTEVNINAYVADAVAKELKFIGYKRDLQASIIISGDIHEFSFDYVGFTTCNVRAKIEFVIVDSVNGKATEVYRQMHDGFYSANKFSTTEPTLVVNEGLRKCIHSFVKDAQKKQLLY